MKEHQDIELQRSLFKGRGVQAIILAGGLGTRLKAVVNDLPKCMAPVHGIPFINFIVSWLRNEGVERFIFSLGYKHELLTAHLDKAFPLLEKHYSIEDEPLGTGGAIKKACEFVTAKNVVVVNGDTIFNIDLESLLTTHTEKKADCTVALKQMKNFSRYGSVEIDTEDHITAFHEKKYCERGLINGGIYAIDKAAFLAKNLPKVFSFEKDYLEKFVGEHKITGVEKDFYFIDIGIPEDYQKFQDDYMLILSKKKYDKNGGLDGLEVFFEGLISSLDLD